VQFNYPLGGKGFGSGWEILPAGGWKGKRGSPLQFWHLPGTARWRFAVPFSRGAIQQDLADGANTFGFCLEHRRGAKQTLEIVLPIRSRLRPFEARLTPTVTRSSV
jgi:hypothetical protein